MSKSEATASGGASYGGALALTAVATAAAFAVGACGGGEPAGDDPPAPPTQTTADPSRSEDGRSEGGGAPDAATRAGGAGGADGGRTGEPDSNADEQAGAGACVFEAPPGRLAEDTVAIDLSGASCEEGSRLAKAAALGQPAGANLELSSGGFRCVPSTTTKGANVTYTCSRGADEVSFEVLWTAP